MKEWLEHIVMHLTWPAARRQRFFSAGRTTSAPLCRTENGTGASSLPTSIYNPWERRRP